MAQFVHVVRETGASARTNPHGDFSGNRNHQVKRREKVSRAGGKHLTYPHLLRRWT